MVRRDEPGAGGLGRRRGGGVHLQRRVGASHGPRREAEDQTLQGYLGVR